MTSPRYKKKHDNINDVFRNSFSETSAFLRAKCSHEEKAAHYNMDVGIPIEEYFRSEFGKYVPPPFVVDCGTVVDRDSYSAGECDFVVFDPQLTPFLKFPPTSQSRSKFLPVECTYGIVEIKKTLTLGRRLRNKSKTGRTHDGGTLFQACEKLFAYKELARPSCLVQRAVRRPDGTERACANDSFAYAFFYKADMDLASEDNQQLLLNEFLAINRTVPQALRINGVFVLDECSILWVKDDRTFAYHPYESAQQKAALVHSGENTLYNMYVHLSNMLRITDLEAPIFNNDYGGNKYLKAFPCIERTIDGSSALG